MARMVDDLHDSEAFRRLRDVEKVARRVFYNSPNFVPGPLQVPAFAQETFLAVSQLPASDERTAEFVRRRHERHAAFLARQEGEDAPQVQVVLDEAVLRRAPAGSTAMRQQIELLLEVSQRPTVQIAVIPFDHGMHPGLAGTFEIHDELVFLEGAGGDSIVEGEVDHYQRLAASLVSAAASGDESRTLMAKLISG